MKKKSTLYFMRPDSYCFDSGRRAGNPCLTLFPRARARFVGIVPVKWGWDPIALFSVLPAGILQCNQGSMPGTYQQWVNHESAPLTFLASLADIGQRRLRGVNP